MKPMGTITKYYPFIDEESKFILTSLMEESSNYNDFVQKMCKSVVENDVLLELVFIAAIQAWWTRSEESVKMIQEKYKNEPCIRPWSLTITSSMSDQMRYHDAIVTAIEKGLKTTLADWMKIELHFLHAYIHYPSYGDVPSFLEPLEKARELMESNSRFMCFQPLILMFEGYAQWREEHSKDSIDTYMRGLEIARKTDDKLYIYLILEPLASATVNFDVQKSLELFQEMYEVAQDLNVSYMIGEVLYDSAFPFGTAGEYDLAISSIEEAIKTLGSADDTDWLFLSRIYAVLGDGQRALEWVNRAFEDSGQVEYPRLYLNKSWALALLNRVEEAESNLETAYSLILKTGKEFELGLYYHGAGVIERTKTNYQAALDFFEKAKEIFDRLTVGYHNIILLDLAQTEILNSSQSIDSKQSVIQGKWLSRLEKHAIDRNLPGLRMQAAMLKAEFYAKHKLFRDARAILVDALDTTDSPGVKTLRKMIKSRILELNHFIGEEETLP